MLRSLVAGAFAAAGVGALTPACSDNNSSLFITAVLYDKAPTCVLTPDPTAEVLGGGVLDLAFTSSYQASLLVGNQLTSRGSKSTLRTETSRVTLRGAEIKLTDSQGNTLYNFSVNGTGFVDVSRGEDSGFGIFDAQLIPAPIGTELIGKLRHLKEMPGADSLGTSDQVIALVRVFGNTLGNEDITSSELSFPITYCEGCLINFPLEALDPANSYSCTQGTQDVPQGGCRLGQDDPVDCRTCAATSPLCLNSPAAATGATNPDGGM
jgi:hypothetical protein